MYFVNNPRRKRNRNIKQGGQNKEAIFLCDANDIKTAVFTNQMRALHSYTLHATHYTLHTTHYTLHTTRYTLRDLLAAAARTSFEKIAFITKKILWEI